MGAQVGVEVVDGAEVEGLRRPLADSNATGAYRYQRGEFLEVICLKKIDIRRYVCSDTNPTIETKSARDMFDTHLIADTSKDSYRFISVHVVTHRSADHIDPTAYISCPYHAK